MATFIVINIPPAISDPAFASEMQTIVGQLRTLTQELNASALVSDEAETVTADWDFTGLLQVDGAEVYHPGNKGDADTLDGKDAASFLTNPNVDGVYSIGSPVMAKNVAASTIGYSGTTSGVNLRRSDAGGNLSGSALTGTYFCTGHAPAGAAGDGGGVTEWIRIY